MDGAAVAVAEKELSDRSHDQNLGFSLDLVERRLEIGQGSAIDDLGGLHDLAGRDVEPGHISANILVPDDRKNATDGHREAFCRRKAEMTVCIWLNDDLNLPK